MRFFLLFSVIVSFSLGHKPRVGYNKANQSFVIRRQGAPGVNESHHIMYGIVDMCQEYFFVKDLVNDEDIFVEYAKETEIVSCKEPDASSEIVDAYGITAEFACSPGSSHRALSVTCSAGGSPFGGFLIYLGDKPGCELENAVSRCGGAFVKFQELIKGTQDALQAHLTRRLEEADSSVETDGCDANPTTCNANSTTEITDSTAPSVESNPAENEVVDIEPQAFESVESTPSQTEDVEPSE